MTGDKAEFQHTVYRKPTTHNRNLNEESHHHASQIQSVANTLISRSVWTQAPRNERHTENLTTKFIQKPHSTNSKNKHSTDSKNKVNRD